MKTPFGKIKTLTCLFTLLMVCGCNDWEYTPVTVTMVNRSTATIYMWIESLEEKTEATKLTPGKSRQFYQVYTFDEEHPATHLNVVGSKNGVLTSLEFKVNADTFNVVAAYGEDARIHPE